MRAAYIFRICYYIDYTLRCVTALVQLHMHIIRISRCRYEKNPSLPNCLDASIQLRRTAIRFERICVHNCLFYVYMHGCIQYCTAFNHTSGSLNKFSVLSSDNLDIYWKRCMLQTTLSAYNFTRMYVHVLLAKRFIFSVFIRVWYHHAEFVAFFLGRVVQPPRLIFSCNSIEYFVRGLWDHVENWLWTAEHNFNITQMT